MRRSLYFGLFFISLFWVLAPHAIAGVHVAIDSPAVHFGDVYLPNYLETTVTITDTATAPVDIIDVSPFAAASADYRIIAPGFPQVLSPQSSITVTIRFTPQAEGQRSALLIVHTADGDISIIMVGNGKVEHSTLMFSVPEIDMGKVAPNLYKDSVIKIYSTGVDSATIYRVVVGAADTSFTAYLDGVTEYPIRLAPGDSLPLRVRFTGLLPTGIKLASLSVVGAADPTISVSGDVEWGAYDFVPETMDFGGMYIGEERDSTVYLRNNSDVDIEVTSLDHAYGSFSYINPPTVPFILRAHDSIAITVRANPGANSYNTPDVGAYSANAQPQVPKAFFLLTSKGIGLTDPDRQTADYYCAKPGPTDITVPLTDTVPVPFYITCIAAVDTTIGVTSDVTLPDTIRANETHSFSLHISAQNRAKDTVILAFYTGDRKTVFDTVYITSRLSIASGDLVQIPSADSLRCAYEVRSATLLSQFGLDTVVVHLSVSDINALDLDTTSFTLPPGMSEAKIVRVVKEANGYAVWIASTTPIVAPVGSSLLSFNMKRFVSTADSATVSVTFESPERAGCLEWSGDTTNVALFGLCGSSVIHDVMAGNQLPFWVAVQDNPVADGSLSLNIQSPRSDIAHIEIRNVLGTVLLTNDESLKSGSQMFGYTISNLKSGTYFIVVALQSGRTASLKFSKL